MLCLLGAPHLRRGQAPRAFLLLAVELEGLGAGGDMLSRGIRKIICLLEQCLDE